MLKCRHPHPKPKSGTNTVANPDLTTPDELGDENMRVLKLRSRLITLNVSWTCIGSDKRRFLRFCIPRRRHRAQHQNSPVHPSRVTRFAGARGVLCIFASIHRWPPRAFSWCASCPQGFNYSVHAKSALSEVSGRVFHGVPKSARSTKIDRLLDLLEW